jgi:hypothetical protein
VQRILFFPLSVIGGLFAARIGRNVVTRVWATVDDDDLPSPDRRDVTLPRLVTGLAIEGVVFSLARGLIDHGLRKAVEYVTGKWPGK